VLFGMLDFLIYPRPKQTSERTPTTRGIEVQTRSKQ